MLSSKEERYNDFLRLCEEENFEANEKLTTWLLENGYFSSPASTKYHGAYKGGLYDHSRNVFCRLKDLTERNNLEWKRPQSPFIIGMFHDLCKCDQYVPIVETKYAEKNGAKTVAVDIITGYGYNQNTMLKGHGSKSVMLLSQFVTLTEEELLCIRYHMGAYEKEEWAEYDRAIKKYVNCLWTHTADMLASKVDEDELGG